VLELDGGDKEVGVAEDGRLFGDGVGRYGRGREGGVIGGEEVEKVVGLLMLFGRHCCG